MEREIIDLLKEEHFKRVSELWSGKVDREPVDDVENFVCNFECGGDSQILRMTHSSHRSEDQVIAELDWINYLYEKGVSVSTPIPSENDRLTEIIPVRDSYFIACLFERAPGHHVSESNPDEWNLSFFKKWGKIIGKMHALAKKYNPVHLKKKRPEWNENNLLSDAIKYVPDSEDQVIEDLRKILIRIKSLPKDPHSLGLIHNDLNPTNIYVHNGDITIFDFDDCCYNWFICDIAKALPFYSQMFEREGWEESFSEFFYNFMLGYSEENRLDNLWFEYLSDFLQLQNIDAVVFSFMIDEKNRRLYNYWFEKVHEFYKKGHKLYGYDFLAAYESTLK